MVCLGTGIWLMKIWGLGFWTQILVLGFLAFGSRIFNVLVTFSIFQTSFWPPNFFFAQIVSKNGLVEFINFVFGYVQIFQFRHMRHFLILTSVLALNQLIFDVLF